MLDFLFTSEFGINIASYSRGRVSGYALCCLQGISPPQHDGYAVVISVNN